MQRIGRPVFRTKIVGCSNFLLEWALRYKIPSSFDCLAIEKKIEKSVGDLELEIDYEKSLRHLLERCWHS